MAVTEESLRKMSQRMLLDLRAAVGDESVERINRELDRRMKEAKKANGETDPDPSIAEVRPESGYFYFSLKLPVSVNALYIPIIPRGRSKPRIVLSNAGRRWKRYAKDEAKKLWPYPPIEGQVAVHVMALMPDHKMRDTSNLTKALYDALEGVCYENDSQIDDEHIQKVVDVDKGGYILFGVKPNGNTPAR